MKRRFSTRDVGLSVRMVVALVLVAAFYAGILLLLYGVTRLSGGWAYGGVLVALVVLVFAGAHMANASKLLLTHAGAVPVAEAHGAGHVLSVVQRLAALADIPSPDVYVLPTPMQNAFTVGARRRSSAVVVTTGLVRSLHDDELEAVVAHELSHIANRDAAVLTVASVPRVIGETLLGRYDNDGESLAFFLWFFVWWLGLPLWAVGTLLTLTISRYREFAADRGSAILTGRPESLMSALVKLDGAGIPTDDLRSLGAAEAFCIVPAARTRFAWLRDHPPLQQRLAALEALARGLGRPVS